MDPDKVRAIQEIPAPTTKKQVNGFLGRFNYISQLISRMTATCGPNFKLLRKDQEYDIEYHTQKAIKGSILDGHLAQQPIEDYQSIQFDFPNEDVMYLKAKDCDEPLPSEGPYPESRWGLIFDGVVNAYGNGIRAVIITPQGSHITFTARLTFICTNNVAMYEACIMGLEETIDLRIKIQDVYGDSALVINQIKGERETRQPGLITYKDYVRRLLTF
ncbi:uncharacterized protein LOC127080927 [Lathyrus oleraceus]|uniref:uncharacterized protein LOC127080927 n=1 Tax=Pisum sativum TaxID=3888 RepID=UPI0021D13649|nr:uncharacterized protein LOC127080927 [Pisum sativum]